MPLVEGRLLRLLLRLLRLLLLLLLSLLLLLLLSTLPKCERGTQSARRVQEELRKERGTHEIRPMEKRECVDMTPCFVIVQ